MSGDGLDLLCGRAGSLRAELIAPTNFGV